MGSLVTDLLASISHLAHAMQRGKLTHFTNNHMQSDLQSGKQNPSNSFESVTTIIRCYIL
ncbi:hypothetical protein Hanom_Chr07g00617961 [Helianthus anomalus]